MVSALDSGSNGPGSTPGRAITMCSWARHFILIVPLFIQVYKWVQSNLGWCSIYQVNICTILCHSIVWSLLSVLGYCLRARPHCCVLCDVTRDLLLTWYMVLDPEFTAEVTLRWTSISSRGSRNTPSRFMLQKPGQALAWWATWLKCRLTLLKGKLRSRKILP